MLSDFTCIKLKIQNYVQGLKTSSLKFRRNYRGKNIKKLKEISRR